MFFSFVLSFLHSFFFLLFFSSVTFSFPPHSSSLLTPRSSSLALVLPSNTGAGELDVDGVTSAFRDAAVFKNKFLNRGVDSKEDVSEMLRCMSGYGTKCSYNDFCRSMRPTATTGGGGYGGDGGGGGGGGTTMGRRSITRGGGTTTRGSPVDRALQRSAGALGGRSTGKSGRRSGGGILGRSTFRGSRGALVDGVVDDDEEFGVVSTGAFPITGMMDGTEMRATGGTGVAMSGRAATNRLNGRQRQALQVCACCSSSCCSSCCFLCCLCVVGLLTFSDFF